MTNISDLLQQLPNPPHFRVSGKVVSISGPLIQAQIPHAKLGDICHIIRRNQPPLSAQVMGFEGSIIRLAPYDDPLGIGPGDEVQHLDQRASIQVSDQLIGKTLDALGKPLDSTGHSFACSPEAGIRRAIYSEPPSPLSRLPIEEILHTGVRSIDTLCCLGMGQRVGLFAGPGVGKSTLLGMIAQNAEVDLNVIALVGERGREVNDFIQNCLGPEGLAKSILVVATSDESAIRRSMAAFTAMAIAEHFRAQKKNVLLLVDSLTRVARAIRDMSLAAGELPVRQGYTPSVYSQLPKLVERAGNDAHGTMSAVFTVLTTYQQESDPLAEEIKSLLDGHLVLDPAVAREGIRPAIDISASVSRLADQLLTPERQKWVKTVTQAIGRLKKDKDLVMLGGSPDAELSAALQLEPELRNFLSQHYTENADNQNAFQRLQKLSEALMTLKTRKSDNCSKSGGL